MQHQEYDGSLRLGALTQQFATGDQPPSSYAITSWVRGEPGAFPKVIGLTVLRTATIVPGLWLFGVKEGVWKGAFGASLTITLGIALLKLVSAAREPQIATNATMPNELGHIGHRV